MRRLLALVTLVVLFPAAAAAQDIPAVGADATLDVATWNIEWFGSTFNGPSDEARQLAAVRDVITASEVDLWALQEIADRDAFAALLAALGEGWDGTIATNSGQQRVAFVYRTEALRVRNTRHILEQYDYEFAGRPPYELEAEVTLPDTSFVAVFVVVHMKAFSDRTSWERRVEAARRLKTRFDFFEARTPLLLLGDFNDEVLRSIYAGERSPYAPFVEDPDDYRVLSLELEAANRATFCGSSVACSGNSTVDHIVATDELARAFVEGSADRYEALLTAIPSYVFAVSDHLPVFARFSFRDNTSSEREARTLGAAPPPYPNPHRERLTVPYVLDRPADVAVEVFDLLGRRVASAPAGPRAAGPHTAELDARLAPGVYTVRVTADGVVLALHRVVRSER